MGIKNVLEVLDFNCFENNSEAPVQTCHKTVSFLFYFKDSMFTYYFKGNIQTVFAEQASNTIHDLRQSLRTPPALSPSQRRREQRQRKNSPGSREKSPTWDGLDSEHADYSYGEAVRGLRELLNKSEQRSYGRKNVQFSHRSNKVYFSN